jgi:undecaprenyl-phosphate 4-deoxy-4-formamido-L-arabinose transferase
MTPQNDAVSVVVPVYNASRTLPELARRLCAALMPRTTAFEILLVDDGSADGSFAAIRELAGRDPRIKGIRLRRNAGQHNALLCGVRAAAHPVTVTLDDDLQHYPEDIPALLDALTPDRDVVYGVFSQPRHGFLRTLASKLTKRVLEQAMGVAAARDVGPFRAFRTELRQAFAPYRGAQPNLDVLLSYGTQAYGAVPVRHEPRAQGVSGYTFLKLLSHALNMLTGFTVLPLRFASLLGMASTVCGLGLFLYVIVRYLFAGSPVQGFPFLASVISLFSGVQLLAVGILGEYFARMYLRLMDKPAYTEAERLNLPPAGEPPHKTSAPPR